MSVASQFLRDGYAGDVTTLRILQLLARLSTEDEARACACLTRDLAASRNQSSRNGPPAGCARSS